MSVTQTPVAVAKNLVTPVLNAFNGVKTAATELQTQITKGNYGPGTENYQKQEKRDTLQEINRQISKSISLPTVKDPSIKSDKQEFVTVLESIREARAAVDNKPETNPQGSQVNKGDYDKAVNNLIDQVFALMYPNASKEISLVDEDGNPVSESTRAALESMSRLPANLEDILRTATQYIKLLDSDKLADFILAAVAAEQDRVDREENEPQTLGYMRPDVNFSKVADESYPEVGNLYFNVLRQKNEKKEAAERVKRREEQEARQAKMQKEYQDRKAREAAQAELEKAQKPAKPSLLRRFPLFRK